MTIDEFNKYHEENPKVYEYFEKFTFKVINAKRKYFSARAIYERIRWETQVEDNNFMFKMSDHPLPFYSRLFEKNHPEYKGFFRKHRCEADKVLEDKNAA